jgi:Ca2+:H+ antiporter
VRGSLAGSVISNLLLVLGLAMAVGETGKRIDRNSLLLQLGLVAVAVCAFIAPSVAGWHGDPERHSLAVLTAPLAAVLLMLYVVAQTLQLRSFRARHAASGHEEAEGAWPLSRALLALALATGATAFISEILVHSLKGFAESAGLSQFFISIVIVAVIGNAAEHGGAIVIASRGKLRLASEIAVSSSAQVAVFVTPLVALLSWLVTPALPLAFRWEELGAMALAVVVVTVVVFDGCSKRWQGFALIGLYLTLAVGFGLAGDR